MSAAPAFIGARGVRTMPSSGVPDASGLQALKGSGIDYLLVSMETVTPVDLSRALDAGLRVMLHTRPNDFDGPRAAAELARLGVPTGATLWLLLDGPTLGAPHVDPITLQSAINAWARAIIDSGRLAGLHVGAAQPLTGSELYALAVTRYSRGPLRVLDRYGQDAEPTCGWCMIDLAPPCDWAGQPVAVSFVQEDSRRRLPTWLAGGPNIAATWTLGLDASRWQGRLKGDALDGAAIAAADGSTVGRIDFAYFKATHGIGGIDPEFIPNATSSAAMRRRGFYMWLVPSQDPIAQADHFVQAVRRFDRPQDLPPAIDFEDDSGGRVRGPALLAAARRCIERVEAQLRVRRAVVYTGRWFWIQSCADLDDAFFADRPLWHAQYPGHVPRPDEAPTLARPWASRGLREALWQFDGDRGLVLPGQVTASGQPVDADFNRFRGDVAALDAFIAGARGSP